jgi:hypothetical protein
MAATAKATEPLHVHLVGSVPLEDADNVFRTVCAAVGPYLKRLPDGETGARKLWVGMISAMLNKHPALEIDADEAPFAMKLWNGQLHREMKRLRIKPGYDLGSVPFQTRYADMAIESFTLFDHLQRGGVIPPGVKFQIAIPSPVAPTYNYIAAKHRPAFLEAFSAHLFDEVREIAAVLPPDRIAIQWDVLQEILVYEDYFPDRPADYRAQMRSALAAMGNAVPVPVELGYHLCYGSPKDEHLVQPKDTAIMVEIVQGIVDDVRRPVDFVHLPVPKPRTDAGFFAPLGRLSLAPDTDLLLGLVHPDDDDGNRTRLAAARAVADVAGISSECGWGRGDPARVAKILEAHRRMVT